MKKWLIASTFVISLTLVGCVEQEDKNIDIEVKKEETQQQETANTAKVQKAKIQDGVDEEAFQKH